MSREDWKYKRQALTAAKDLCYGNEVIARIKMSQSAAEIDRIMATARKNMKW